MKFRTLHGVASTALAQAKPVHLEDTVVSKNPRGKHVWSA